MKSNTRWLMIFIRDFFLALVLIVIHIYTNFQVNIVWLITGMMIVWFTWHFDDYKEWKKWHSQTLQ